jgi:alkanesulfonate monooxygenase SsuD/methylene tetrahydromethanopterin reductase-like flavin-dependent oxidoreductase (luciferase family)
MTFFPATPALSPMSGRNADGPLSPVRGFDAQRGPQGALLIGNPDEVIDKIVRYSGSLGGISRISFQMNAASLPHAKLMQAIEAIGTRVAPAVRQRLAGG